MRTTAFIVVVELLGVLKDNKRRSRSKLGEISLFLFSICKQLSILPHHYLVHLLHGICTIIIKPSGDDGTKPVDKERGFIVAGGVIAFGFEMSAELLGVRFYIFEYAFKLGARLIYEALCEHSE